MRYSESHSGNRYGVTIFNYLAGTMLSFLLLKEKVLYIPSEAGKITLLLATVNAILFVGCLLVYQHCIQTSGAPMTSTFNRLGILIPTVLSAFLFHEIPTVVKALGLGLALVAIFYMNGQKTEEGKSGLDRSLLLLFVVGGFLDFTSKVFGIYGDPAQQELFVLYTFFISMLLSIGVCLKKNRHITKQDVIAGLIVGIPNQLTSLFLLKAVTVLPAYMVFPVYSAAVILLVNVVNFVLFHELLSRRQYIGTGIIALSLVLINI